MKKLFLFLVSIALVSCGSQPFLPNISANQNNSTTLIQPAELIPEGENQKSPFSIYVYLSLLEDSNAEGWKYVRYSLVWVVNTTNFPMDLNFESSSPLMLEINEGRVYSGTQKLVPISGKGLYWVAGPEVGMNSGYDYSKLGQSEYEKRINSASIVYPPIPGSKKESNTGEIKYPTAGTPKKIYIDTSYGRFSAMWPKQIAIYKNTTIYAKIPNNLESRRFKLESVLSVSNPQKTQFNLTSCINEEGSIGYKYHYTLTNLDKFDDNHATITATFPYSGSIYFWDRNDFSKNAPQRYIDVKQPSEILKLLNDKTKNISIFYLDFDLTPGKVITDGEMLVIYSQLAVYENNNYVLYNLSCK